LILGEFFLSSSLLFFWGTILLSLISLLCPFFLFCMNSFRDFPIASGFSFFFPAPPPYGLATTNRTAFFYLMRPSHLGFSFFSLVLPFLSLGLIFPARYTIPFPPLFGPTRFRRIPSFFFPPFFPLRTLFPLFCSFRKGVSNLTRIIPG